MADYAKELEKNPDAPVEEKQELEKLASLQKDIAVGGSAEDFIRHPFFKSFENKMNEMISDSKSKILEIETIDDLKAHKAAIQAIVELKNWLNKHVLAGRFAKHAVEQHEKDTDELNAKIQEVVDQATQE